MLKKILSPKKPKDTIENCQLKILQSNFINSTLLCQIL